MTFLKNIQASFAHLQTQLFQNLTGNEQLALNLHVEESSFIRFNNNKVRQNTQIEQANLHLRLQAEGKVSNLTVNLSGNTDQDLQHAKMALENLRKEVQVLPKDPYLVDLANNGSSEQSFTGKLPDFAKALEDIHASANGTDMAGLYCAGPLLKISANSLGQSHSFYTENFFLDFSLYNGEKAVKGIYAGSDWDPQKLAAKIELCKNQLALMSREKKTLSPGNYRTYLAPGAVAEIASMFSWGSFSYSSYKQGYCGLKKLIEKEATFSPKFHVRENFKLGFVPRFNDLGEVAAESMDLIHEGQLKNMLVSTRSAKEFSVQGNFASSSEGPRSLEILPGNLAEKDILKELGTGLYLSNLHYINWSDIQNARITGMTRYACFWVENGEIVSPIADMRFDESLYEIFGKQLVELTQDRDVDPQTSTYEHRALGAKLLPGVLLNSFNLTL